MRIGWFGGSLGVDTGGLTLAHDGKRSISISGGTLDAITATTPTTSGHTISRTEEQRQILRSQLLGLGTSDDDVHPMVLADAGGTAGFTWMGDAPSTAMVRVQDVQVRTQPTELSQQAQGPSWSAKLEVVDTQIPRAESLLLVARAMQTAGTMDVQAGVPAPFWEINPSGNNVQTLTAWNPLVGGSAVQVRRSTQSAAAGGTAKAWKGTLWWSSSIETWMNGGAYVGAVDSTGVAHPIPGRVLPHGFDTAWVLGTRSWEIGNGLIRVRPTITGGFCSLTVEWWNGTAWSLPLNLQAVTGFGLVGLGWSGVSILRSSLDQVTIAVGIKPIAADANSSQRIELTVRRGSPSVRVFLSGQNARWGLRANSASAGMVAVACPAGVGARTNSAGATAWYMSALFPSGTIVENTTVGELAVPGSTVSSAQFTVSRVGVQATWPAAASILNDHYWWASSRTKLVVR